MVSVNSSASNRLHQSINFLHNCKEYNSQPLIKSVREIRDRPDIWVVTNKNHNPETWYLKVFIDY